MWTVRKPELVCRAQGAQMGLPLQSSSCVGFLPGGLFGVAKSAIRITLADLMSLWNYLWLTSSAGSWAWNQTWNKSLWFFSIKWNKFVFESNPAEEVLWSEKREEMFVFQAYRRSDSTMYKLYMYVYTHVYILYFFPINYSFPHS